MTRTTMTFPTATLRTEAPRGSIWAAQAAVAVWRFLESVGESRSRRALLAAADRVAGYNPSLAAEFRAAAAEIARKG